MRKALVIAALCFAIFCTACGRDEQMANANTPASTAAATPTPKANPFGAMNQADFELMVKFIETKGVQTNWRPHGSMHQFTFLDTKGNRHALIATRLKNNERAVDGTVGQISVWAYGKGVKDQDHFVGYIATPTSVGTDYSDDSPYLNTVAEGFKEFLTKVKSSQ